MFFFCARSKILPDCGSKIVLIYDEIYLSTANNDYYTFEGAKGMINKLFSFLGFNSGENYVGLSHLIEDNMPQKVPVVEKSNKDLKLSDLMRGN